MIVEIPKRRFNIDIEGKVFVAKELSMHYLENARLNPHEDNADEAIKDSIGVIPDEDLHLFGIRTKEIIYSEILKFTFTDSITKEDVADIIEEFNITEAELNAMDSNSKAQLKSILLSRKPKEEDPQKKKNIAN